MSLRGTITEIFEEPRFAPLCQHCGKPAKYRVLLDTGAEFFSCEENLTPEPIN